MIRVTFRAVVSQILDTWFGHKHLNIFEKERRSCDTGKKVDSSWTQWVVGGWKRREEGALG